MHAEEAGERQRGREQLGRARRVDDVRAFDVGHQVLPERRPAEPVEADRAQHHGHEGEHPRHPLGPRETAEGHPEDEPAVVLAERSDPGEQPEVDGEAVAVVVPGPPAERGHAEPHRVAVERDRERERARARRLGVRELERSEQGERDSPGPDAEPLWVLERRRPLLAQTPPQPRDAVRDCEPRVENPPDVPEQHLDEHEPQPERDVDERRREVLGRGRLADQRGQEDEHEQAGRDGADDHSERGRPEDALEPLGERTPRGAPLELRPLPERTQREEREDEDDGAAPEEEPLRNRQVLDAADPVGEQAQGRTSSSAI